MGIGREDKREFSRFRGGVTTKDSYGRSSGRAGGNPELTREELESGDPMLTFSFSKAMLLIAKLPDNRCEAGRF